MDILYERCAAGDVHKKTVVVCRMRRTTGQSWEQETRTFGTTTGELLQMLDWVQAWECTHFAMESTGEYWKPVYNILEGNLEVWLVNARHVKAVPGRKTDVQDAVWLADLLRHGLLRPSFIPPRGQRELRDLTRQRSNLVRERASVVNRLQKVLEDANLKLASVASDVTGVSARAMLEQIIAVPEGAAAADPAALAALGRGRLRSKRDQLEQALTGRVRAHHRFLLGQHLAHLDFLEE
jgi:transposase